MKMEPVYKDEVDIESPETAYGVIGIAFIIPNSACTNDFWDYAVTIDEVERRTCLDLYSLLADEIEIDIESRFDLTFWKKKFRNDKTVL